MVRFGYGPFWLWDETSGSGTHIPVPPLIVTNVRWNRTHIPEPPLIVTNVRWIRTLIIENNKSRKIKEFKSKAETALCFVESYGLVPQYLKLESTDGQTVKVDRLSIFMCKRTYVYNQNTLNK
jgi:hypothetical protein